MPSRFAENDAQQVRQVLQSLDVLVGIEQLGAEHPDCQVQHQHRDDAEDEVVELHSPVLRARASPSPRESTDRRGSSASRRQRRSWPAPRARGRRRHALPGISTGPDRARLPPDRRPPRRRCRRTTPTARPRKKKKTQLQRAKARSEDQIHASAVAHDRPLPDRAEAEDVPADLADPARHVGPVDVAHDDRRDEQHRRIHRVQPREAVEHALRRAGCRVDTGRSATRTETGTGSRRRRPRAARSRSWRRPCPCRRRRPAPSQVRTMTMPGPNDLRYSINECGTGGGGTGRSLATSCMEPVVYPAFPRSEGRSLVACRRTFPGRMMQ